VRECLGKSEAGYEGGTGEGTAGSFSLSGNHEMYANGNDISTFPAYPWNSLFKGWQTAGQLLLSENDIWRILALDTGYTLSEWAYSEPTAFQ